MFHGFRNEWAVSENRFNFVPCFFEWYIKNYSSLDSDQLLTTRSRFSGQVVNIVFFFFYVNFFCVCSLVCSWKSHFFVVVVVVVQTDTNHDLADVFTWLVLHKLGETAKRQHSRQRINHPFKSIYESIFCNRYDRAEVKYISIVVY